MNGNIFKVDNLKDSKGKRRGFIMTQNEILDRLYIKERDANAYALYCFVWQRGNSDFNLTVDNLSNITGVAKNTIRKSLQTLKKVGLIEEKQEKNVPGMPKVITTQDGRKVPNNSRKYVIYSALPYSGETVQLLTPGTFIMPAEFTADEILESESTPQAVAEIVEPPTERQEPPQVRQKMPQRQAAYTPPSVLKPPQSRAPVQSDSKMAMAIERRKEKVYRIADESGLFSKAGKEKLLYWLKRFTKEVGRLADDNEVAYAANMLSGDSSCNLSSYIKRKALSELPA